MSNEMVGRYQSLETVLLQYLQLLVAALSVLYFPTCIVTSGLGLGRAYKLVSLQVPEMF